LSLACSEPRENSSRNFFESLWFGFRAYWGFIYWDYAKWVFKCNRDWPLTSAVYFRLTMPNRVSNLSFPDADCAPSIYISIEHSPLRGGNAIGKHKIGGDSI
jgi:hypothetical protein